MSSVNKAIAIMHSLPESMYKLVKVIFRFFKNHFLIIAFSIVFIILGILTYDDFGATWDERQAYDRGVSLYQYFFHKKFDNDKDYYLSTTKTDELTNESYACTTSKNLELTEQSSHDSLMIYTNEIALSQLIKEKKESGNMYYNAIYSMVLFLFNKQKSYEIYHLLNILFSLSCFVFIYIIFYKKYRKQKYAIIAPLLLFLTPRFLGHIPANPKDIPFANVFIISIACIYFLKQYKRSIVKVLILGLLFGLTMGFRTIGFNLIIIYCIFSLTTFFLSEKLSLKKISVKVLQLFLEILTIMIIAFFVIAMTMPYIGSNIFQHIPELLTNGKNFPWEANILFGGQYLPSSEIGLSYLPIWFLITTPLFISFFAIFSLLFIKNKKSNSLFLLLWIIILVNVVLVVILKPNLYDGLRHFLFLLPIIVILASESIINFFKNVKQKIIKYCAAVLIVINIGFIIYNIITLHPYQYMYFNALIGGLRGAYMRFETEYWGAAHQEGIQWFSENIAHNDNKYYYVFTCADKEQNVAFYSKNMKYRRGDKDDYKICTTRWQKREPTKNSIIHTIKRHNIPILFITEIKNPK